MNKNTKTAIVALVSLILGVSMVGAIPQEAVDVIIDEVPGLLVAMGGFLSGGWWAMLSELFLGEDK